MWWLYVIQSTKSRIAAGDREVPGFCYVGISTNPARRLRQHNGSEPGGARFTQGHRPWVPRALYGPYMSKSEALKAEITLKRTRSGEARFRWSATESPLCRGEGPEHPWVADGTWEVTSD